MATKRPVALSNLLISRLLITIILTTPWAVSGCSPGSVHDLLGQTPTPTPSPSPSDTGSPLPAPEQPGTPGIVHATAIFSDDFDSHADWQSQQRTFGGGGIGWPDTYSGTCTTNCPPVGWTSYRVAQSLWTPNARDTYLINSAGARGSTGKGLTYNIESTGEWGTWAGGGLDKHLGAAGYQELYVRFWIKEPPEFCWGSSDLNLNAMGKFLRITALRRDPTTNPNNINPQIYPSPDTSPTLIGNAYRRFQPNYGIPAQFNLEERYAPNYEMGPSRTFGPNPASGGTDTGIVFPNDSTTGGAGYCGDNRWHSYETYVKMNTPGGSDGIYRVWLDGALAAQSTGVPWVKPGTDTNGTVMTTETGWNWVMIADNIDSTAYPKASKVEMSRYIDDVVISEHYSGPPPAPTTLNAQSANPQTVQLSWAAGTNGATYLLSGYRIRWGTAPGALNQAVVVEPKLTHELSGLTSGQTYYFQITALKKATYDSNENESPTSNTASVLVQ